LAGASLSADPKDPTPGKWTKTLLYDADFVY